MAVQLSSSYLRRSYQLLARAGSDRCTPDEAFERAGTLLYRWARSKFSRIFTMPPHKATLDEKRDGNELGVIYDPDAGQYIFRCAHPDARVAGRIWITDVQLNRTADACLLAVRLSVSSLHDCTEPVPFSCPGFIGKLVEEVGLSDIVTLTHAAHDITMSDELDDFLALAENKARRLPVVLVTPCARPEDGLCDGYMLDADTLARDLCGVAHVYRISPEANDALTERIGRQWSAFNGAVRTYYPDLSFSSSDPYRHPYLSQQSIRLRHTYDDDTDYSLHEIEEYVQNYTLGRRMPWEETGIAFYLAEHQTRLRQARAELGQSADALRESYEQQLDQLQKQCEENLALADSYSKDCDTQVEENEQLRLQNRRLKAQIATLRYQMQAAGTAPQDISTIGTYAEIPDWVGTHYADRLVLLPRAIRSLKSAAFEDVGLVYRSLQLLATSYYDYRTGSITYDEFNEAMKNVDAGLEERAAITQTAAGMQGDTYYVTYHGKSRKLERHLTKGNSRDERYCMRIYYIWDDQEQQLVICDLPRHLDTAAT